MQYCDVQGKLFISQALAQIEINLEKGVCVRRRPKEEEEIALSVHDSTVSGEGRADSVSPSWFGKSLHQGCDFYGISFIVTVYRKA